MPPRPHLGLCSGLHFSNRQFCHFNTVEMVFSVICSHKASPGINVSGFLAVTYALSCKDTKTWQEQQTLLFVRTQATGEKTEENIGCRLTETIVFAKHIDVCLFSHLKTSMDQGSVTQQGQQVCQLPPPLRSPACPGNRPASPRPYLRSLLQGTGVVAVTNPDIVLCFREKGVTSKQLFLRPYLLI